MQHLRELIEMGFAPMMALVIVVVIVLWLTLVTVVVFGFKMFLKDRNSRDTLRKEQLAKVEERLQDSEKKHSECEEDREKIHTDISALDKRLSRYESCPRKGCPMRLPM